MGWLFEKTPPMGGATGEAFSNVLLATGMNPSAVLAREAIQNSVDAVDRSQEDKVRVVFRQRELTGERKNEFVQALGLGDFVTRRSVLELQKGTCLESLSNRTDSLRVLFVEDYGTHGLRGDPHSSHSHFYRLLLSLGDGSKARGSDTTGGSYGYGKAVYSANSRIHTIVAYSVVKDCDDTGRHHARLLGCSYFRSHTFDGEDFTGRAWFGTARSDNPTIVDPFEGDSARRLAEKLGFAPRDSDATGTSILIVDCPVVIGDLRCSVEDWWWPRILEDDLDIEIEEDGKQALPPRPRSRPDLLPFIHCFEMAIKQSAPEGRHDKSDEFNRYKGIHLGRYGFTLLEDDVIDDEDGRQKVNQVALIRAPRMVVKYMDVNGPSLPCVGTFVAAQDVDHTLRLSEPPAHDNWDVRSSRFQSDDDRELVETITRRLKASFKRFAFDAIPPKPKGEVRLGWLERLLGRMFQPPTSRGRPSGGSEADPIEIHYPFQHEINAVGEHLQTTGEFSVGLKAGAGKDLTMVSVEVQCFPVEDDGVSRDEPIKVTLSLKDDEKCDSEKESDDRVAILLNSDNRPRFHFVTSPYPSDWTVQVKVNVMERS